MTMRRFLAICLIPVLSKIEVNQKKAWKSWCGADLLYETAAPIKLIFEHMEPDGVGVHFIKHWSEYRRKLEKEGLFWKAKNNSCPTSFSPNDRCGYKVTRCRSVSGYHHLRTVQKDGIPIAHWILFSLGQAPTQASRWLSCGQSHLQRSRMRTRAILE